MEPRHVNSALVSMKAPLKLRLTSPLLDGILNVDHRLVIVGHPVKIGDVVPAKKLVVLVEDRTPTSVQFPFRTRR